MAKFIAQILEREDYPKLNEVAAGIGQLLSDALDNQGNLKQKEVMQELVAISTEYGVHDEFISFLNFYPDYKKKRVYKK